MTTNIAYVAELCEVLNEIAILQDSFVAGDLRNEHFYPLLKKLQSMIAETPLVPLSVSA